MEILKIKSEGFRNLAAEVVLPQPGVNVLLGSNGQGKTNVLEMIHILGNLKSFRDARRDEYMKWGEDSFTIIATLRSQKAGDEGLASAFEMEIELAYHETPHPLVHGSMNKGRSLKLNGNRVKDIEDYFSKIKIVCFSPEDLEIITGEPRQRRRFMDRLSFQLEPRHLSVVKKYQHILNQRNALLRQAQKSGRFEASFEPADLEIWTEQLLNAAADLSFSRLETLSALNRLLPEQYKHIAKEKEEGLLSGAIAWQWVPKVFEATAGLNRADLLALYREEAKLLHFKERQRGQSLWGPHLEDFQPFYGAHEAASFASMGQKKTLLLALRLSELVLVTEHFEEAPLLLMDDISAELDAERLETLVAFLSSGLPLERDGKAYSLKPQIFLTTVATSPELLEPLGEVTVFNVHQGFLSNPLGAEPFSGEAEQQPPLTLS